MISVKSFMVPADKFITVDGDTPTRQAAELMCDKRVGSVLVTRGGAIIGILTDTDLVRRIVVPGVDASTTPVEQVMTAPVLMIDENKTLLDANDIMARGHTRHLGVSREGKIVGMITVRDVIGFLTNPPSK